MSSHSLHTQRARANTYQLFWHAVHRYSCYVAKQVHKEPLRHYAYNILQHLRYDDGVLRVLKNGGPHSIHMLHCEKLPRDEKFERRDTALHELWVAILHIEHLLQHMVFRNPRSQLNGAEVVDSNE